MMQNSNFFTPLFVITLFFLAAAVGANFLAPLPSEPPDVRNWFSSYVYESPSLGSNEGFIPSLLEARKREEEKHSVDFDSVTKIGLGAFDKRADTNSSSESEVDEVPDAFQSEAQLLDVTEPPDVRNWFSSYRYESPVLSTAFGEDSSEEAGHGGECYND